MSKVKGGIIGSISLTLVGLAVVAEIINFISPLAAVPPSNQPSFSMPTKPISLPWPDSGQSAIGAPGYGLLASSGAQTPAPTASVAKVITALAVLKQKPLAINEQGPLLTLTQTDVDNYKTALAEDGSVVPVAVGEQISERQVLEAMLLPSANNMARSLAQWAFGSLAAYNAYANKMVKTLGMSKTSVSDASGFDPATVSTASDLVKLGLAAMNQPVLAQIVAEPNAQIPVAGQVQNINDLLGQDGIVGIKTGNTDQAGGCFLFAANHKVLGQNLTIVGTVMGAPTLYQSMVEAHSLVIAVDGGFSTVQAAKAAQAVGVYKSSWGTTTQAIAQTSLPLLIWKTQPVRLSAHLEPVKPGTQGGFRAGTLITTSGLHSQSVPVVIKSALTSPSIWWRLTHP
jgi:D-alanyl-D-alanine carboxypeptidase (penicillin-binding protein 5/6)